jgi:hypothetical protein
MKTLMCALLLTTLTLGCSSSEPAPEGQTTAKKRKKKRKKKNKRSKKKVERVPPRMQSLPEGHVLFTVKKADLKLEVLPIFEAQAGKRIVWSGEPRKVSLRLLKPIHWEDALDLVCQFSRTHITRDYSSNRLVLKDGWSGRLASSPSDTQPDTASGGGARGGSASRSSGSSASRRSSSSSSKRSSRSSGGGASSETWENNYGGGEKNASGRTAQRLLKGVSRTSSGPR